MGTITQDNLYLLLPGKVMAVAEMYARHHDVTLLDAMRHAQGLRFGYV